MTQEIVEEARQNLIERIKNAIPKADIKKIEKAFDICIKAHEGQVRASGEPYILHPISVANILIDFKLDTASIITALLHDTLEDTNITAIDVERDFGNEIAKLVDGVTKLTKIENQPEHIKQAENFRKLLLAVSKDIRVLLVKLADRLHNMRTIDHLPLERRMRMAHETMEIYSPLAERIGIHKIKNELQDLSFAILHSDIRKSILNRLEFLRKEGKLIIDTIIKEIEATVKEVEIDAEVQGREKTPCSIWLKMERKNVAFEQLVDIIAFRVLVNTISECYTVLGAIHSKYHMIPNGFKDYISTPKANGYQSLHTIVIGPEQRCIEIQIRTYEMHEIAEFGVAAHWAYKQREQSTEGTQYKWIRELLEILKNASNAEEFLENTKLEMYYDQVFCFTPKGELIALPKGATPIDFAFAVHSNIGLSCIGAKVNGRVVPLRRQLENGDQVEILRSKMHMPSPAWEKFVVTGKAKAEIRKFIRSKQREEYLNLGRSILIKTFQQQDKEFEENKLKSILEHFKRTTVDDLVIGVGEGFINRLDVLRELYPDTKYKKESTGPLDFLRFKNKKSSEIKRYVPIRGLIPGMAIHFAKCCHPVPGDRIVGIVNSGKGITIHTSDCNILESVADTPERWLSVTWEGGGDEVHVGRMKVILSDEPGSLASITEKIASENINISNVKVIGRSEDFIEVLVDVEVKGLQQLISIITAVRGLSCVHTTERYKD